MYGFGHKSSLLWTIEQTHLILLPAPTERPKLYRVLASRRTVGLKTGRIFYVISIISHLYHAWPILTLCMLGNISRFCCQLHKLFSKIFLKNTIRVSNCFYPDQDRHSVGLGLGPSCLRKLSAYNKSPASKERVNYQL